MALREFIKLLTPPIFLQGYHALRGNLVSERGIHLTGDYPSWQAAMKDSTGYDSGIILEKTRAALLKVKNGEAVYERDSVLFDEIQYSWPLLVALMWVAARSNGNLNVLDFGGSLGSTYFQNRAFFADLYEVRWNIVEQEQHVEAGKKWFEDDRLKFYASLEACLAATRPKVILLSGVLQYLPDPYGLLDRLSTLPCETLIIDRTPFFDGSTDRLCVQHVPAEIYPATYPSWIFSLEHLRAYCKEHWDIVAEFDGFDQLPAPVAAIWKGMIGVKRKGQVKHG